MRRVVLSSLPRCVRCRLPTRWCVCAGQREIRCPLQIDVLMHHREQHRPSSTGHLINRVFPDSRHHVWRRERALTAGDIRVPERELWMLHPHGERIPDGVAPAAVQVLLLDGAWSETSAMVKDVGAWGRLVSLPMTGKSRYWLRDQQDGGRFSTVEALMFLLDALGMQAPAEALRVQLELHVYAHLRARGRKDTAHEFLENSSLVDALPDVLEQLNVRRPR